MQIVNLADQIMSSLFRLPLLAALVSLALPGFAEQPRVATVNAARAFEAYWITAEERAKIAETRAALKKDPRLDLIKLTRVELLDLRNGVRDDSLPDEQREEFFRKFQMKAHELRSLQRDTVQHIELKSKEIDADMVKKTRELLATVRSAIEAIAQKGRL